MVKARVRGKFIARNACIRKEERVKINNLSLHLGKRENEEQYKPNMSRRKETNIRTEMNEIKYRKIIEKHQ